MSDPVWWEARIKANFCAAYIYILVNLVMFREIFLFKTLQKQYHDFLSCLVMYYITQFFFSSRGMKLSVLKIHVHSFTFVMHCVRIKITTPRMISLLTIILRQIYLEYGLVWFGCMAYQPL